MRLTVPIAATSFSRPIAARPTTYSDSRSGVAITLRMLRVHVSSMNPVATAIWLWNRTWNSMIPASRYGVVGPADVVLLGDERAERAPQQHVEHRPERDVEPAVRAAEQHVAVAAHDGAHAQPRERRAVVGDRGHDGTSSSLSEPEVFDLVLGDDGAGQLEEDALEVAVPEGVGHLGGGAVGDDLAGGEEHHPLAEALDLDHVVAGDEEGGAVVGGHVEQAGAHPVGDVGVEAGGGLVEHEQLRVVEDRLDDADERALARTTAPCTCGRPGG